MFAQPGGGFSPTARVLVAERDPGRAEHVALGRNSRALCLEGPGVPGGLSAKGCALVGVSTVATARHHQRKCPLRVAEPEVKGAEAAHREAHDVRLLDAQVVEYCDCVRDCSLLRVP